MRKRPTDEVSRVTDRGLPGVCVDVDVELEADPPPALETSLLSALGDAVIVADEESRIVYANPVTESLLGWPAAALQGRPLTMIVPRRIRQTLLSAFERRLAGGLPRQPGRALRVPVLRMDGTEMHVELVLSQVCVEDGRRLVLASLRGVAGRVELHRLLQSERAARIEAERARAEAERIEQRLAVLAKAGKVLGSSLDYRRTLQDLSELGLGLLGEMCVVALADSSQRLILLGGAHLDPAKRALLEELRDVPLTACSESEAVVRTGTARVLEKVDGETLQGEFDSDAHRALVRKLQLGPTMILPLTVRQHTIGVLVFSAPPGSEPYTPADVALGKELARRAAVAVDNARLFAETSEVAHTLQQRLLPPRLPQIPGVDIAARYHPAGERLEVGGDFYDAFSIGEDCWGFIIGDVAGKGPGAAATTAVVRHTARAAARQAGGLDVPAAVNEALLEAEQEEQFSTMIFGRLRFVGGDAALDLLNCGHPAPLLVRSEGRIDEVECRGPLLGQLPTVKPDPVTLTLLPGDVLVLVTDGVLEARAPASEPERESLRFFGHEGLTAVLTETRGEPAETIARRIAERAVAFSGGSLGDDLAVLVLRILDR